MKLAEQRCYNHAAREAAARCPGCRRFFCRECVVEHEHRFLCAHCLQAALNKETSPAAGILAPIRAFARLAAGLLLLWVVFYVFGQALLLLPSEFHELPGTVSGVPAP